MALEREGALSWPNQHSESSWSPDDDHVGESSEDSVEWCEVQMDIREAAGSTDEEKQDDFPIRSPTRRGPGPGPGPGSVDGTFRKSSSSPKLASDGKCRRRHCQYTHDELFRELDETVASVEKYYLSSTLIGDDDSVASQSIATQDDHSIYAHRNLIDNIHFMSTDSHSSPVSTHSKSNSSRLSQRRSRVSRSSLCSMSRCRRKRGDSLEREIVLTILRVEAESVSCEKVEEVQGAAIGSTADYILQDLHQACAILKCELEPPFSSIDSGRHRARFNPQLPPIQSESALAEDEDEDTVSHEKLNPDVTEIEDFYQENHDGDSACAGINCIYDDIGNTSPTQERRCSTSPAEVQPRDCDVEYNPSSSDTPVVDFTQRHQSFLESEEWTTFKENPFEASLTDSPSSVALIEESHFTKIRPWKSSELGWRNVATNA